MKAQVQNSSDLFAALPITNQGENLRFSPGQSMLTCGANSNDSPHPRRFGFSKSMSAGVANAVSL